jgi:hypothetical protein
MSRYSGMNFHENPSAGNRDTGGGVHWPLRKGTSFVEPSH